MRRAALDLLHMYGRNSQNGIPIWRPSSSIKPALLLAYWPDPDSTSLLQSQKPITSRQPANKNNLAMIFNIAFILSALAFFQARASPVADGASDLVLLSTQETANGTLTFWGYPDGASKRAVGLEKRQCGSNAVTCSGSHTADVNSCRQLISSLRSNGGQGVGTSPRSICTTQNGNQCCVSWADAVSGLTQGNLVNAAQAVLNDCAGSTVSGLSRDTNLNGVCTTECLSNRATGCSN
ncbi:hypothetical protein B0H14DRAFT_2989875 [Mycena olivaceomarginata]|nr:hypothetical protein B0H14DRAFT_2989875 [Mycena olivaceomarginata]